MEQVALADGLEDEGVLARRGGGARAGGGEQAENRLLGRLDHVPRDGRVLVAQTRSEVAKGRVRVRPHRGLLALYSDIFRRKRHAVSLQSLLEGFGSCFQGAVD